MTTAAEVPAVYSGKDLWKRLVSTIQHASVNSLTFPSPATSLLYNLSTKQRDIKTLPPTYTDFMHAPSGFLANTKIQKFLVRALTICRHTNIMLATVNYELQWASLTLQLEIVLERVLVMFWPEQHRFGLVSEHFVFWHRTMQSVFDRYLAYNVTILQTIDITVSSNVWSMLYVMSSNGKCVCSISTSINYRRASWQMRISCVWFGSVPVGTN